MKPGTSPSTFRAQVFCKQVLPIK